MKDVRKNLISTLNELHGPQTPTKDESTPELKSNHPEFSLASGRYQQRKRGDSEL